MDANTRSTVRRRNGLLITAVVVTLLVVLGVVFWPRAEASREVTLDDGTKVMLEEPPEELRRRAHQGRMKQVADYFALPEREREGFLDRVIDEQQAAMERLGIDPGALTKEGGQIRMGGPTTRPGGTRMMAGSSAERSLTQDLSAADQARMAEFTRALMDRRKARGIEGPVVVIHTANTPSQ